MGEISRKLVSIEKGAAMEIERCRNGGEEECYTRCVEECGKSWEKGLGKRNEETCRNRGWEVCCMGRGGEGRALLVERVWEGLWRKHFREGCGKIGWQH